MALEVVNHLTIGTERDLRLVTPKGTIVAMLDRFVPIGWNKHALPAQIGATIIIHSCESSAFHS
jgi:hypothetical protein